MQVAGDLVYKFQDFLGAEEIAERIERSMPPTLVPPKEGQPPRPPQPPPPQMLVKMEEMKVKQAQLEVEKQKLQVQKLKALKEAQETSGGSDAACSSTSWASSSRRTGRARELRGMLKRRRGTAIVGRHDSDSHR